MTREEINREREFNRPRLLRQWRKHNPGVRIKPMLAHSPNYYVTDDGRILSLRREENHRGKFVLAETRQFKLTSPACFRGGVHNYWQVTIRITLNNQKNFPNVNFTSTNGMKLFPVHRLVAYYFCTREFFDRTQVDHIDGNPTNNHASNLEWVTPAENYRRAKELRKLKKLQSQTTKN